jgi:uncharacterized protein YndB with AHSA1/START domain
MRRVIWCTKPSPTLNMLATGWAREALLRHTLSRMLVPAGGGAPACIRLKIGRANAIPSYPDLWQGGVFKEVVPPERVVYTFAWEGQGGQPTRETLITIIFTELDDDRTQMDFHQAFFDSVGLCDGHNQGWNSSFDRLNDYLKENAWQLAGKS